MRCDVTWHDMSCYEYYWIGSPEWYPEYTRLIFISSLCQFISSISSWQFPRLIFISSTSSVCFIHLVMTISSSYLHFIDLVSLFHPSRHDNFLVLSSFHRPRQFVLSISSWQFPRFVFISSTFRLYRHLYLTSCVRVVHYHITDIKSCHASYCVSDWRVGFVTNIYHSINPGYVF